MSAPLPRPADPAALEESRARALAAFAAHREEFLRDLAGLCRAAGVSSERPASEDMRISASLVAALAELAGLEAVRVREVNGSHPYVTGSWLRAPGAPTVLFYSHHDVQPCGDPAAWTTPPTAAEVRNGRLYARGAVDDKGGIVAQIAAVASVLRSAGALPCNVRLLVDGEEEVGSPNLTALLESDPEIASAEVVVVVDTPNAGPGRPALTTSLRGNVGVDVEVRCLDTALHSGRGAGLVPDPIQVLARLLNRLSDESGALRVPGVAGADHGSDSRSRQGEFAEARVRLDAESFRREAGLRAGVRLCGDPELTLEERVWRRPALTVIGIDAPGIAAASNQIVPAVRARLSLRTAPGSDPERDAQALVRALEAEPPCGAEVRATRVRGVAGWESAASGAAIDAALRALEMGYGSAPARIGAGGSIGFMSAITRARPGVPCVLMGLEDPGCNAHAPDESLSLADWESATRSLIHFLHEFAVAHGGKR